MGLSAAVCEYRLARDFMHAHTHTHTHARTHTHTSPGFVALKPWVSHVQW